MPISKNNLIKISDYLWEIPRSFRGDMRVPARIYATGKMLDEIIGDRSLAQLVNVAVLPGIQKYALAMPDIHEGYASPIGGVAAIRTSDGIIAPGMQGYDINCLHPESLISLSFGTFLPIKKIREYWQNFETPLINKKSRRLISSKIINFLFRKEDKFLYYIKTKSGFILKATGDHPIYTQNGMKNTDLLKMGDKIITYPFKGVLYERAENLELVNKKKIFNALIKLNFLDKGNRWAQIIKWFNEKKFINLNLHSWQTPYLIKIIGYLFGDGTLNFMGKDRNGVLCFYGKFEDLKQIQRDLKAIKVHSKIYSRKRFHRITNFYKKTYEFTVDEHCLRIGSTAFTILLYILGMPLGNKVYQELKMPSWLKNKAPLWQKRLFLASFFGAELSTPSAFNKFNLYAPTLNINKAIPLEKNGIQFLNEIRSLLSEFGIKAGKIVKVDGLANRGKTVGLRFQIGSSSQKLINFFETIGFEYNREKQRLACLAVAYLKQKEKIVLQRQQVRNLMRSLYNQGARVRNLISKYSNDFIGKSFIEHSTWSSRGEPRIAFNFHSFEEFIKKNSFGKDGFVIDEIEEIKKENYKGLVYDLTINNENHNFIANNFMVSNCGVRLAKSNYTEKEIAPYLDRLAGEIQKQVPSGLGKGREIKLSEKQIDDILEGGAPLLVKQGYGEKEDVENCEAGGYLAMADAKAISGHAKNRGGAQVGTLGSGNHFLEIQKVDEIFDAKTAEAFGLFQNQVVLMIHCGSRGLGHQVCTDYLKEFIPLMESKYKIKVPDREFACVPFNSQDGQRALAASAGAANFAFANRQMILHFARKAWKKILGENASLELLYDVAHNIIKIEKHKIDGKETEVAMHRKGATRAFPPGHPEIPLKYRSWGQPVLIPGSMGTASYVLAGAESGEQTFYSSCHGAGRQMSRHEALRMLAGKDVIKNLENKGIIVKVHSVRSIAEEAPQAYKNIDEVVGVVEQAGLSKKVARLMPLAVIKGE